LVAAPAESLPTRTCFETDAAAGGSHTASEGAGGAEDPVMWDAERGFAPRPRVLRGRHLPGRRGTFRGYRLAVDDAREATDAGLVVALARSRQDALAEVYRRHGGALFGMARRVIGHESLAEEVVQEVFLHLWRHPDRFDPGRGSLRSYLLAIGHARSVDAVRSEVARRRREEKDAVQDVREDAGAEERVAARLDAARSVGDALDSLPDEERRPIELAYFGGRTYREVAAFLGEPEGTIKSRIRSGLRRMRGAMSDEMVDER